jgi:hypothetical protein
MADMLIASATPELARHCAACGYDLRGLPNCVCPECGLAFDPRARVAEVPWLNRGRRGAFRAYWATVVMVLLRPRRFGEQVWRPVEVDAKLTRRFRVITIVIPLASFALTVAPMPLDHGGSVLLTISALLPATIVLWLITGAFHLVGYPEPSTEVRERYERLHDLSCAGLALSPLIPTVIWVSLALVRTSYLPLAIIALMCTLILVPAAWWVGAVMFQFHGGRCGGMGVFAYAVVSAIIWAAMAAATALATTITFSVFSALLS